MQYSKRHGSSVQEARASNGGSLNGFDRLLAQQQFEQAFQLVDLLLKNARGVRKTPSIEAVRALSIAQEAAETAIVTADLKGNAIYYNPNFVTLWDLPPGVLATQRYSQYVAYCRQRLKDPEAMDARVFSATATQTDSNASALANVCLKDGRCLYWASHLHSIDGEIAGRTWVYRVVNSGVSLGAGSTRSADRPVSREMSKALPEENWAIASNQTVPVEPPIEPPIEPAALVETEPGAVRQKKLAAWFERECTWLPNSDTAIFAIYNQQVFATNSTAEAITGYHQSEMSDVSQFQQLVAHFAHSENASAFSSNLCDRNEFCLITKSGKVCWLKCAVQNIVVEGECLYLISAIDITELKQQSIKASKVILAEWRIAQQRSQLIANTTHRSMGALNLISMSADVLEAYGGRWSDHKKQTYTNRIKEGIAQLAVSIKEIEEVGHLGINQLFLSPSLLSQLGIDSLIQSASGWSKSDQSTSALQTPLDCIDVHRLCYRLVETFKAKYRQHAFVTFCLVEKSKVQIDPFFLQVILSHLIDNISQNTSASLVKVMVNVQPSHLVIRIYNMHVDGRQRTLTSESERQKELLKREKLSEAEVGANKISSKLMLVTSLIEVAQGNMVVEREQERTVVTVRLPIFYAD